LCEQQNYILFGTPDDVFRLLNPYCMSIFVSQNVSRLGKMVNRSADFGKGCNGLSSPAGI